MCNDVDHPNVTLSEWEAFKASETARQSLVREVVDRSDCGFFPDWYAPLARGAAIASDVLLREAGYRKGMHRPPDWLANNSDCFVLYGPRASDDLIVRRCGNHECWIIERGTAHRPEVLVCSFGSTPIVTPSYISAMCLAMHCNVDNPPHGLRWIKQAPDDCEGAIEFALERNVAEIIGECAPGRSSAQGRVIATPHFDVSRLTR
jgi:hypothetical protein